MLRVIRIHSSDVVIRPVSEVEQFFIRWWWYRVKDAFTCVMQSLVDKLNTPSVNVFITLRIRIVINIILLGPLCQQFRDNHVRSNLINKVKNILFPFVSFVDLYSSNFTCTAERMPSNVSACQKLMIFGTQTTTVVHWSGPYLAS